MEVLMKVINYLSLCHIEASVAVNENCTTIMWKKTGEEAHKIEIIDNGKERIVHHTYLGECKTAFFIKR